MIMWKSTSIGLVAAFLFCVAAAAYALFEEFPNDKPFTSNHHPRELVKIVNQYPRVYGYGGDDGITFYFKGNTEKLNRFLADLAKVKGAGFSIVLFPEPGRDKTRKVSFVGSDGIDKVNKVFSYNWSLNVRHPLVVAKSRGKKKPGSVVTLKHDTSRWLISVSASLHGDIDLVKLKLPLEYEAFVDSRLTRFVEWHNERRNPDRRKKPTTRRAEPTSEKLIKKTIKSSNLFGP